MKLKHPVLLVILLSLLSSCQGNAPSEQPLANLIQTLKSKDWTAAQKFFAGSAELDQFPLYQALESGSTWIDLVQVQSLDHHLIFKVDLHSPPPADNRVRYTFWGRAPQYQGMTKTDIGQRGLINGWTSPRILNSYDIDIHHLDLPRRFASTAYRLMGTHREQVQNKSQALGVIGQEGSGAIEDGWTGSFELQSSHLRVLNKKRKRSCRTIKRSWLKYLSVFQNNLQVQCMKHLLFAAQRHRYIDLSLLVDRIDVSRGRGGQNIRIKQDQKVINKFLKADRSQTRIASLTRANSQPEVLTSGNGVSFNGRMTLQQSLEFAPQQRSMPTLLEAIIVAPPLTQCIQRVTDHWSRDFLKQDTCQYTLTISFSVSESDL